MLVKCSWCGDTLREKEPFDDRRVSHTICPQCAVEVHPAVVLPLINAEFDAAAEESTEQEHAA